MQRMLCINSLYFYRMLKAEKLLQSARIPLQFQVRNAGDSCGANVSYMHLLKSFPRPSYTTLTNGIRIATEKIEGPLACVGLFVKGGSRYENRFENGVSHFFSHIAFKSTRKRSACQLFNDMSALGARFNCFTTRELIAFYAQCHWTQIESVLDILSDCVFCNAFDERAIECQKEVIKFELKEHDEDSSALLFDYLHAIAFNGTPLSNTVVGLGANLPNFNQKIISRYVQHRFFPAATALAVVSAAEHDCIVKLACDHLNYLEGGSCIRDTEYRYSGGDMRYRNDDLPYCHAAVAFEGPPLGHEDNIVLDMASQWLGGWDISQPGGRKNACALARAGSISKLCIAYEAFNIKYSDTALWGVQFMAAPRDIDEFVLHNIQHDFMKLCIVITGNEVKRMKNELLTHALTKKSNPLRSCLSLGRWTVLKGARPDLVEYVNCVNEVTPSKVREVCEKYIYDRCPVVAGIGAIETLPDYNRIRSAQYWLRI